MVVHTDTLALLGTHVGTGILKEMSAQLLVVCAEREHHQLVELTYGVGHYTTGTHTGQG